MVQQTISTYLLYFLLNNVYGRNVDHNFCLPVPSIRYDGKQIFERSFLRGAGSTQFNWDMFGFSDKTYSLLRIRLYTYFCWDPAKESHSRRHRLCAERNGKCDYYKHIFYVWRRIKYSVPNSNLTNIRIYLISEKGHENCRRKAKKNRFFVLCLHFHLHHCRFRLMSLALNIFGL